MELILVMLIIAVAAALVAPSMVSFQAGRANANSATLILSLAGYARTQAVSDGRTYRLNLDPTKNVVWLTAGNAGVFTNLNNDYGQQFPIATVSQMKTDITAHPDGTYVEFQSNGRTDPAKIWLTDNYNRTVEVACDSSTEMFRIVTTAEVSQ
jgi:Tfp pilus assembly protein FimT